MLKLGCIAPKCDYPLHDCETKYFYMAGSQNSAQNIEKIAHFRCTVHVLKMVFARKKLIGNLLATSYFKNSSKKVHYCILHVLKMVLQEKKIDRKLVCPSFSCPNICNPELDKTYISTYHIINFVSNRNLF